VRYLRHDQHIQGQPHRFAWVHQVGHVRDSTKVEVITQGDELQPCVANLFFEVRIN
jgi:hypothetical protein